MARLRDIKLDPKRKRNTIEFKGEITRSKGRVKGVVKVNPSKHLKSSQSGPVAGKLGSVRRSHRGKR